MQIITATLQFNSIERSVTLCVSTGQRDNKKGMFLQARRGGIATNTLTQYRQKTNNKQPHNQRRGGKWVWYVGGACVYLFVRSH